MLEELLLQWGRSFSERRTRGHRRVGHRAGLLQWGRSFSERRTSFVVLLCFATPCFNGAALFQSGEPVTEEEALVLLLGASMGPLFFRAENQVAGHHEQSAGRRASMGPLFFRAENASRVDAVDPHARASMGPLFFRAENVKVGRDWIFTDQASMGPLFFRAENSLPARPPAAS